MNLGQAEPILEISGAAMDTVISQLTSSPVFATKRARNGSAPREHAEHPKRPRSRLACAVFLILLAPMLTAVNITGHASAQTMRGKLSEPARNERLKTRLTFAATEIERFKRLHSRLPANIQEVGLSQNSGLVLLPLPGRQFQLRATDGTLSMTFNSKPKESGGQQ